MDIIDDWFNAAVNTEMLPIIAQAVVLRQTTHE